MIKVEHEGAEIEVYTADEVKAQVEGEVAKVKTEFGGKVTDLESELTIAKKALGDRAGEFKQFRELHADVVEKLSVAERTIYENQKLQHEEKVKREGDEKVKREGLVANAIKAKTGADEKLFEKVKGMYELIGIEANTSEEIERKVLATLGAIGSTEPNALASIAGFSSGSYIPPTQNNNEKSFADSEKGKAGAAELGLKLDADKK